MLANVPPGDYMKIGALRLNKMPYENWRTLGVGHSDTAFIMKDCKDGSICKNKVIAQLQTSKAAALN